MQSFFIGQFSVKKIESRRAKPHLFRPVFRENTIYNGLLDKSA